MRKFFPSGVDTVKNMTALDPELCNTTSTENSACGVGKTLKLSLSAATGNNHLP